MQIKKIIALGVLIGGLIGGGYYFFSPSAHFRLGSAFEDLQHRRYRAAEEKLDTLDSSFQVALYRGYLAQLQGQFHNSDVWLQQALQESRHPKMTAEILLAQAANAYFEKRNLEISPLLERAKRASLSNEYLPFFDGLVDYLQHNFNEALRHWTGFEPSQNPDWNRTVFERLFSPAWLQMHFAHSLVEEGDLLSARMILEREMHLLSTQEEDLHTLASLFLSLTYLKESAQIPDLNRHGYYKLANYYLEQAGSLNGFPHEKDRFTAHLKNNVLGLFDRQLHLDWAIGFTKTLHEWQASSALEEIAARVAPKLLQGETTALCRSFSKTFQDTDFHTQLTQQFSNTISRVLKQGETLDLNLVQANIQALGSSPIASSLTSWISDEIYATVNLDEDRLTQTKNHLNVWKMLEKDPCKKTELAQKLLTHSEFLWQREDQEKKGTRLMEIALGLAGEREHGLMLKKMERFLVGLYHQAEETNMVHRLSMIYDTLDHFAIGSKGLVSSALVANHLADAKYLMKTHNYASTKTHAEWVLKLDSKNQEALRLLGLSTYHLGEYTEALASLKELSSLDEYARKALVLSKAFSSQEQERHLAKIDDDDPFEEKQ